MLISRLPRSPVRGAPALAQQFLGHQPELLGMPFRAALMLPDGIGSLTNLLFPDLVHHSVLRSSWR